MIERNGKVVARVVQSTTAKDFNAIVDKLCMEYEIGMYQDLSESLESVYSISNGLLGTSEG